MTVRVSRSAVPLGSATLIVLGLTKVKVAFSLTPTLAGPETVGGLSLALRP